MLRAKQQRRDRLAVAGEAIHRQIERCLIRLGIEARFRFGHRLQLRNDPLLVVIEANAQVNLVRPRILFEGFHQGKYRIASVGINFLKHGESP